MKLDDNEEINSDGQTLKEVIDMFVESFKDEMQDQEGIDNMVKGASIDYLDDLVEEYGENDLDEYISKRVLDDDRIIYHGLGFYNNSIYKHIDGKYCKHDLNQYNCNECTFDEYKEDV